MDSNDKKAFASLMYALGSLYDMDLENKVILKIWFEALSEYTIEEVGKAVTAYIKSPDFGTYKPKPADIIKMISGTASDNAFLAWSKFIEAVKRVGTYSSVVFDDPIIHRVVDDMGGWCSFGTKTEKELPFVQNEFVSRYRAFRSKPELPTHSKKLVGIIEAENAKEGFEVKQIPVFIGDKKKAQIVYKNKELVRV